MPASTYRQSADWYDRIYAAQGKDYAAEAALVARVVRELVPDARSVLDVACGTGRHLEQLAGCFGEARGIDLSPDFVAHARERGLQVETGDMRTMRLGRTFDAVVSLFSGVAHVESVDELDIAVAAMARHVAPGGALVVEPWFAPDQWHVGDHGVEVADSVDSILVRANRAGSAGRTSILQFAWTLVDSSGITRLDEELRLQLFAPDEYRAAFERAGLVTGFDPAGCNADGRGLWIGVAPLG